MIKNISKYFNIFKSPKVRTNRPMIERTMIEKINQEKGYISNKAARQRLRRMASDTSLQGQGIQMIRYWNKSSPKKKALIASSFIAPKAVILGGGYFLGKKDEQDESE